ncbi:hypothetical protein RI129_005462 [Pyrocoelia pectoralis]|uniref:Carboxylic ester hydrolase n=1 Tax=Pyrocoelia pectoralis TaxID=417401 RepID=A0AAN7VKX5_9COLE
MKGSMHGALIVLNLFVTLVQGRQIEIQDGSIQGVVLTTRLGKEFLAYMSIRYAEPPVGKLRFQPPVPVKPWSGTLNGSKIHGKCPQRAIYTKADKTEGDEDCLFINVYTPLDVRDGLPVMVYIHGGGYRTGCGSYNCYGPNVLLERDVILVAFNYRLGPLGFLSTGDSGVPGNNGLKDQNLALRWVKNNIHHFGGNPDRITIFGQSAGGASVHLHILSPKSQGLFQSAILQSGSALMCWAFDRNQNVVFTKSLAKSLKCPTTSNPMMINCLMQKSPYQIIDADVNQRKWSIDPTITFKPTVEDDIDSGFITQHPINIIKTGNFTKVALIVGGNTEEGSLRTIGIQQDPRLLKEFDKNFEQIAPVSLGIENLYNSLDVVLKKIRMFYFKTKPISHKTLINMIDMYTDARFFSAIDETVRLHKKHSDSDIFFYLFGYKGEGSYCEIQGEDSFNYGNRYFKVERWFFQHVNITGVNHNDELFYLFPYLERYFSYKRPSAFDYRMTDIFTTLWTNFAATRLAYPSRR